MPGQRLIDPADPASVARMLQRLDKVERDLSKVTGQHKRLKKKVDTLYSTSTSGSACSNIQFKAPDATHVLYSSGFVRDAQGKVHQVTGATLDITAPSTTVNVYAVFNPTHGTMQVTKDSATLQNLLLSGDNIYVAGVNLQAFGIFAPTSSATYPTGSTFLLV